MLTDHLPPGLAPRGLSKHAAAAYVGCATLSAFEDRVRRGLLPGPVPGTNTYDRHALDAAFDKLSGLAVPGTRESEADAALRAWRAAQ
jgi:hypothetical protein